MFASLPDGDGAKGFTLVMPAVSHGNAGQLAVDLLIATLRGRDEVRKVATVDSEHLSPVAGADAFSASPMGLSTAADVFLSDRHRLLLLQQRATVLPGHLGPYVEELVAWVQETGVASIVVLAGADAMFRLDPLVSGGAPVHFVATPGTDVGAVGSIPSLEEAVRAAGQRLPQHRNPLLATPARGVADGLEEEDAPGPSPACLAAMQSSGMATSLLRSLWAADGRPSVLALVRHCFEGVNDADGAVLASAAIQAVGLDLGADARLAAPPSWAPAAGSTDADAALFT